MFKKILTLSLVAVMLSVTVLAAPDAITLSAVYAVDAPEGLSAVISVAENNAEITENGLGGSVKLALTSDEAENAAIVVTAVFNGEQLLDAEISDSIALEANVDKEQSITLPAVKTTENTQYTVKFYLWESKENLVPLAECKTITVTPTVEVWSGEVAETLSVATASDLNGEYTGYYMIKNGEDLAKFASIVNGGETTANAVLCNDIHLNNSLDDEATLADANNWFDIVTGIGNASYPFAGTFDGNGYNIHNMYIYKIDEKTQSPGLFGFVNGGAKIQNLSLKDVYMVIGRNNTMYNGALIGTISGAATVSGVNTDGTIVAASGKQVYNAGGIVGTVKGSENITIQNCKSSVNMDLSTGSTTNVTVESNKTATNYGVGGIIGLINSKTVAIVGCENHGTINAPYTRNVGGIWGGNKSGTSSNTFYTNTKNNTNYGNITGLGTYVGGVYGYARGTVDATNTSVETAVITQISEATE